MAMEVISNTFGRNHPNGCGIDFPCLQCMLDERDSLPRGNPQRNARIMIMGINHRGLLPVALLRPLPLSPEEWSDLDDEFRFIPHRIDEIIIPDSPPPLIPVTPAILCTNCQGTNHTSDECREEPRCNNDLCEGMRNHRADKCIYLGADPYEEHDEDPTINDHPHSPELFQEDPSPLLTFPNDVVDQIAGPEITFDHPGHPIMVDLIINFIPCAYDYATNRVALIVKVTQHMRVDSATPITVSCAVPQDTMLDSARIPQETGPGVISVCHKPECQQKIPSYIGRAKLFLRFIL
ncbi:unnamed protein product [Orchesella dallaii]|uniref:Uncharacterized protein n=1 Tax=Orchesella dallaii TaxID=48710 RepID=A0ABP1RQG4_9HEXA